MRPLKILIISSIPNSATLFRFDRREDALTRRLQPWIRQGALALDIRPATSFERLSHLVARVAPDILHIVCHGIRGESGRELAFEDRHGRRTPVGVAQLDERLRLPGDQRPALMILEACGSRPLGEALEQRAGGAVIAMEGDADPAAGARFFAAFYHALALGLGVGEAFAEARRDLELLLPLAVETPVLLGSTATIDARLAEVPRALPRGVAVDAVGDQVSRSAAHGAAPSGTVDDEVALARLRAALRPSSAGAAIVVLRGAAGVGKTTLLRRWLDQEEALAWPGHARVFTWSFDASREGPGVGDVHAFLEEALEFFGDQDRRLVQDDPVPMAFVRGLQLGRLIRRERVLLVLDAVPLLPRGAGEAARFAPERRLHPGLAALLRELARGGSARCVVVIRDEPGSVDFAGAEVVDVRGLAPDAGAELLWREGLLDEEAPLRMLAERLGGHPLALRLCPPAFATSTAAIAALGIAASIDRAPLTRLIAAILGELGPDSKEVLAALAIADAELSTDDLAAMRGALDLAASPLELLRPLVRAGLVRVERRPWAAALVDPALGDALLDNLDNLDAAATRHAFLLARVCGDLAPARSLADVQRLASVAALTRRVGEGARARAIYKEQICAAAPSGRRQSVIARDLGAIAEDLMILGEFFDVDEGGGRRWDALDREASDRDDETVAFLYHRVALALRHLGRVDEAVRPLSIALERYRVLELPERAAICANDLAEVQVARGELAPAIEAAEEGVRHAEACGDRGARIVTRATRGHIRHLAGDLDRARQDFVGAEAVVQGSDAPELASRPGYQYWSLLLEELERAHRAGAAIEEPAIERLRARLAAAREWHREGDVAPISSGLDALARGRLANLEIERARARGADIVSARREATGALAQAVAAFRGHHHLWMLPHALCERARLRRLLCDPVSARIDLDEARTLAGELCLPLARVECALEEIALHADQGRGEEARARLAAVSADPWLKRCAPLRERAEALGQVVAHLY